MNGDFILEKDLTLYTFDASVFESMKPKFLETLGGANGVNAPPYRITEDYFYTIIETELRELSDKLLENDFTTWYISKTFVGSPLKFNLQENGGDFESRQAKFDLIDDYLKQLSFVNFEKLVLSNNTNMDES